MSKAKSVVIVKAPFQLPEKPKVAALRLFKVGHYALTRKIPEQGSVKTGYSIFG
jgi:hypothetical protein